MVVVTAASSDAEGVVPVAAERNHSIFYNNDNLVILARSSITASRAAPSSSAAESRASDWVLSEAFSSGEHTVTVDEEILSATSCILTFWSGAAVSVVLLYLYDYDTTFIFGLEGDSEMYLVRSAANTITSPHDPALSDLFTLAAVNALIFAWAALVASLLSERAFASCFNLSGVFKIKISQHKRRHILPLHN